MAAAQHPAWARAQLALGLLAVDPGLGGIHLRARAGPARDAFLAALRALPGREVRLHPGIEDDQLFGGIDIEATLASGRIVARPGLMEAAGYVVLAMAERTPPALAARLALLLDRPGAAPLIALDEAAEDGERLAPALSDRLAFCVTLDDLRLADLTPHLALPAAGRRPSADDAQIDRIAHLAAALGVDSARVASLALRAASAHAALRGGDCIEDDDLEAAVTLVLVPRATRIPEVESEDDAPPPSQPDSGEQEQPAPPPDAIPDDILIEAARALLPPDLLDRLAAAKARRGKGGGSGAKIAGNRRGRPLTPRPGRLGGGQRLESGGDPARRPGRRCDAGRARIATAFWCIPATSVCAASNRPRIGC